MFERHVAIPANPLPGDAESTWQKCALGRFQDWPHELRGYVLTIAAFPYPAAVFWDRKLTILHNKAWADIGGTHAQGQHYQTSLSAETREVIESVRERRVPKEIHGHDLLQAAASDMKQTSTAIVNPLLSSQQERGNAVLVQLLPRPMSYRSLEMRTGENSTVINRSGEDAGDGSLKQLSNTPLDEHPFFRRFAELLPSGLAILDQNARAIFVNQHFYDLTTMIDNDDKAFTSWPQSIQRIRGRAEEAVLKVSLGNAEEVYRGSGLGLNISRKICHLHGGEIGVSSKEGEGSMFGFFFKVKRCNLDAEAFDEPEGEAEAREQIKRFGIATPSDSNNPEPFEWTPTTSEQKSEASSKKISGGNEIGRPEVEAEMPKEEEEIEALAVRPKPSQAQSPGRNAGSQEPVKSGIGEARTEKGQQPQTEAPGSDVNVLLVEDNIINQKIVRRKLEAKGFTVTTANNGKEAVAAVQDSSSSKDKPFDVILMDQEMPLMSGNTATRAIRDLEKQGIVAHIPILGVTANVRGAQTDEMIDSGMQDVITKPYKIEDLAEMINKLVS